ncbi:MAG TPA: glycosyltransferase family 9 protein [Myxococcota bacterium]|nr:glycosyltransferase family 9 protein [Myxococcota bacterium]
MIVRLSALGDVVHALPMLDALRRAMPDAEIGWLVEEKAASLLADHPQIDRLWVAPRAQLAALLRRGRLIAALRLFARFARELRATGYDVVIDAHSNARSSLLAWCSGARRRIGFAHGHAKEGAGWLYTDRVVPAARLQLKVQRALDLLRPLGIDPRGARAVLGIAEPTRAWARARVQELGGRPAVAIHPGVSDSGAIKQWHPERFGRTAARLARECGARCLVTWGPGERELALRVVEAAEGCAALGPETGSVLELAALYEACDLVIGVDTGPLHLAAALGIPVVGLYGPTDPAVYAPWDARTGAAAPVVRHPVYCSPCNRRRCSNVICMPAIEVGDVVAAAGEELAREFDRVAT